MKTRKGKPKTAHRKKEPERLWVLSDEELGRIVGGAYLGGSGPSIVKPDEETRCGKQTCAATVDVTCP